MQDLQWEHVTFIELRLRLVSDLNIANDIILGIICTIAHNSNGDTKTKLRYSFLQSDEILLRTGLNMFLSLPQFYIVDQTCMKHDS